MLLDILLYEYSWSWLAADIKTAIRLCVENFAFEIQPTLRISSRAKMRPDLKLAIFKVSKSDRRSQIRIIDNNKPLLQC